MSEVDEYAWSRYWDVWDSRLMFRYWLAPLSFFLQFALYFTLKLYVVRKVYDFILQRRGRHLTANGHTKSEHTANGHVANGFVSASSEAIVPRLSEADCSDIAGKVVTIVITGFMATSSAYVVYETADDMMTSRSKVLIHATHIGASYFVYDIYAMYDTLYLRKELWKEKSLLKKMLLFARKRGLFLIHHVILLGLGYPLVVDPARWRRNLGDFLIAAFFLREFSNPPLMVNQILKILNLHHTSVALVTGFVTITVFFISRIANTPLVILYYAYQHHHGNLLAALLELRPLCWIVTVLELCLEAFWFRAIVKVGLSTLASLETSKQVKKEQ